MGFWKGVSLLILMLPVQMKAAVNLTHRASSVVTNSLGYISLLITSVTHKVLSSLL